MHLAVELTIIILFIFVARLAYQNKTINFLILATVFAFTFENLNVWLFANQVGGYYYSPRFNLFVLHTPLFVGLSWGILLLSSYQICRRLNFNKRLTVLAVPLFTTQIDFAIETAAVRLGFWTWKGFESGIGLAQVAPSNFIGWMAVSFGFMLSYIYLKHKFLAVVTGYLIFLFIAGGAQATAQLLNLNGLQVYWLVLFLIIIELVLIIILYRSKPIVKTIRSDRRTNLFILSRLPFYIFAIFFINWHDFISIVILTLTIVFEFWIVFKQLTKDVA